MQIRVVNYRASVSPRVQAFVDVWVDDWLIFRGINFNRDGSLTAAQLTPVRNGKKLFIVAVEVTDADLRALLAEEILSAIRTHVETLRPERRMKPVHLPGPVPVAAQ